jgi:hypothetical protein
MDPPDAPEKGRCRNLALDDPKHAESGIRPRPICGELALDDTARPCR